MPATEGECGKELVSAQRMGVGGKDKVIVLELSSQHVGVFTGWPTSIVDTG